MRHLHAPGLLLSLLAALSLGCSALSSLLGAAAPAAYEAAVAAESRRLGLPQDDPAVLAAVRKAQALAEKRAAEDKARDAAAKADLDALLVELRSRPTCPSCPACPSLPMAPAVLPVVDAGADGGR